ncbi:hypothetical protein GGI12_005593, partial [Dipsacomyces acuminosporus]
RIHIYSIDGDALATALCHDNRIKGFSTVAMAFPDASVHTILTTVSSDGWIKTWRLDDLVGQTSAREAPAKTKNALELHPEPLAKYNADVRLTCVAASNNIF